MKTFNCFNFNFFAGIITVMFLVCSCSDNSLNNNSGGKGSINQYFNSLPGWELSEQNEIIDTYKDSVIVEGRDLRDKDYDDAPIAEFQCPVFDRQMITTIKNFTSVGTNEGKIWPGAIIQGNSLTTGDIRLIQTNGRRADITLSTNIPLTESSKTISPNSVTAQQAIADFKIAAGQMPEGSKAGAGETYFRVDEASSFTQSMRQMGISAGFTEPQSQVGLDASLSISTERSANTHTVAAQFVQEQFKVRIADDLISTPADFFTDEFTLENLEQLEQSGELGPENLPLYIEEVTYGRIMLFSSTSEQVSSSNELSAALEADMANYANLGGEFTEKDKRILASATHKIYTAGGTGEAANNTIGQLDWSAFFKESPASSAVPISFVARTINGKKIAGLLLEENYDYRDGDGCSIIEFLNPPEPEVESYDVTVEWRDTNNTGACIGGGRYGTCSPGGHVNIHRDWGFTPLNSVNSYKIEFRVYPEDDPRFTIRSRSIIPALGVATTKTMNSEFNVTRIDDGNTTRRHKMTNVLGSTELIYRITKETNFKE